VALRVSVLVPVEFEAVSVTVVSVFSPILLKSVVLRLLSLKKFGTLIVNPEVI
jgi:hypothetical protein